MHPSTIISLLATLLPTTILAAPTQSSTAPVTGLSFSDDVVDIQKRFVDAGIYIIVCEDPTCKDPNRCVGFNAAYDQGATYLNKEIKAVGLSRDLAANEELRFSKPDSPLTPGTYNVIPAMPGHECLSLGGLPSDWNKIRIHKN